MTEEIERVSMEKTPEKLSEKSTVENFSGAFKNISEEYSAKQKLHPENAKTLAIGQLKELNEKIDRYKNNPNWQEYTKESRMKIIDMKGDVRSIITFLSKGLERETILEVIFQVDNDSLLGFLPEEYKKNGVISDNIREESKRARTFAEMNIFLKEGGNLIPYFNNDDWQNNPEIITKALSRPGVIVNMYEWMKTIDGQQKLREDTVFIKTLNDILIREYPIFKEAQNKNWYDENHGKFDFNKIATLLDIEKYGTSEQKKHFIEMMNGTEERKTEKAIELYEKYFIGTDIGNKISWHFKDSSLVTSRKNEVQKMLDTYKDKRKNGEGSMYDSMSRSSEGEEIAQILFGNIPKYDLETFLSILPEIERLCSIKNTEALKKKIDGLEINTLYKAQFFYGLAGIRGCGSEKNKESDKKNYSEIGDYYSIDISEKKEELSKQVGKYSIIEKSFPGKENEKIREQKNAEFEKFLNDDDLFSKGKIIVTTQGLKNRLGKIFVGTKIWDKIDKSIDGREIFDLLSIGLSEQQAFQGKNLKKMGFDSEKWKKFQEENILKSGKIIEKLHDSKISTDEKIKILLENGLLDREKIPTDSQGKERLIEEFLHLTKTTEKTRIFSKENSEDFSASWKSGNFIEFNKKIQEQEEVREKKELQEKQETKMSSAIPFDSNANFREIPINKPMINGNGAETVFINKNENGTISLYSPSGNITIEGITINNEKRPFEDIKKAIGSIQFLRETGLEIFGPHILSIINLINNKQGNSGGEKIDLKDGLNQEEQRSLLKTFSKILDIGASEEKFDDLKERFRTISKQSDGIVSRLRDVHLGYVNTDNSLNIFAIKEAIKNTA